MGLALTDFIIGDAFLARAFEVAHSEVAFFGVLGGSVLDTLAPHFPTGEFHFLTHKFDDIALGHAEVDFDGIESGSIFPCHLDDAIYFAFGQVIFLLNFHVGLNIVFELLFKVL